MNQLRLLPGSVFPVTDHDSSADSATSGGTSPATGEQYQIRSGDWYATIGQVAAVLREFGRGDTVYTETWPDEHSTPMACGIVLMPWPNRVAGGRWEHDGQVLQLDITEPARSNASHGLLRDFAYRVMGYDEDRVILAADIYPQHGWPFTLHTQVEYALGEDGLSVTHTVTNVGQETAVFGCGAHPYVRIGEVPIDDLTVTVRARTQYVTNDAMIPVAKEPLAPELATLPTGASLRGLHLDTGFTDLELVDGRIQHELAAPDGRTLTIWADPDFKYTIVFTPDDFPNDESRTEPGEHRALAVEPMTCPTNALNSGEGLIELAPGETWSGTWGLTPGQK